MATNYIKVTTSTSQQASGLVTTVLQLWDAKAKLTQYKAEMDKMVLDAGDFSTVASNFGVSAANGEALYNLLAGALADIAGTDDTDIFQFISRVGP